jgi:hypothetical protein
VFAASAAAFYTATKAEAMRWFPLGRMPIRAMFNASVQRACPP